MKGKETKPNQTTFPPVPSKNSYVSMSNFTPKLHLNYVYKMLRIFIEPIIINMSLYSFSLTFSQPNHCVAIFHYYIHIIITYILLLHPPDKYSVGNAFLQPWGGGIRRIEKTHVMNSCHMQCIQFLSSKNKIKYFMKWKDMWVCDAKLQCTGWILCCCHVMWYFMFAHGSDFVLFWFHQRILPEWNELLRLLCPAPNFQLNTYNSDSDPTPFQIKL